MKKNNLPRVGSLVKSANGLNYGIVQSLSNGWATVLWNRVSYQDHLIESLAIVAR